MRPAAGLLPVAGAVLLFASGGARVRAAGGPDFSRFVAVGDAWTAGFMNGNLFDGATADPPVRLGQRESWAVRLAESMGTQVVVPAVSWPGRAGRPALVRAEGACAFETDEVQVNVRIGPGARVDPSARATVVAVPFQKVGDALTRVWDVDPDDPSSANTDEDMVLGLPWAAEDAPPRTQVETAAALEPTFVAVWMGVEDVLAAARRGESRAATTPREFRDRIRTVVGALAATGADGVIATVPDVTLLPHFVSQPELRVLLTPKPPDEPKPPSAAGLRVLFGVTRRSYVLRTTNVFRTMEQIDQGLARAPLQRDAVLGGREVRRLRALVRRYNRAIADAAEEHGWAVVDTHALFESWRDGVEVGGTRLTRAPFGGLFDLDSLSGDLGGQNPSPTAHALIAGAFADAIDGRWGTSLQRPDAAAILAVDPLAPCR